MKLLFILVLVSLLSTIGCSKKSEVSEVSEIKSSSTSSGRSIASAVNQQQAIVDKITQMLVNEVKLVGEKNNVIEILAKIDKAYPLTNKNLDQMPVAKGILTALKIIPQYEGILWRLRKVAETSDFLHLAIIGNLRQFYQLDFQYGPHLKAFFHFVTTPTEKATYFADANAFMDFLNITIKPKLMEYHQMLSAMDKQADEAFDVELDLRLFTGGNDKVRYLDPEYQKKRLIKPYLYGVLSTLETTIATIEYAQNYHLNALLIVSQKALAISGLNAIKDRISTSSGQSVSKGITAKELTSLMASANELLTLRKPTAAAKTSIAQAFKYVNGAIKHRLMFYTCSLTYPTNYQTKNCLDLPSNPQWVENGEAYLIDPNLLMILYKKHFHTFSERHRLTKEAYTLFQKNDFETPVEFVSEVTGLTVRLRPQRLFQVQPDLKVYIPREGNYAVKNQGKMVTINGKAEWAWNYKYGSAQSVPDFSYNGFFVDATDAASYTKIMRTINLTPTTHNIRDYFFNITSSN